MTAIHPITRASATAYAERMYRGYDAKRFNFRSAENVRHAAWSAIWTARIWQRRGRNDLAAHWLNKARGFRNESQWRLTEHQGRGLHPREILKIHEARSKAFYAAAQKKAA